MEGSEFVGQPPPKVGGQVVRVRDVATVAWAEQESQHVTRFNGRRAVFVTVAQKDGADVGHITRAVEAQLDEFEKTLPGGVSHHIIETRGDQGELDNTPTYVVPAGHYFMMGDNRDSSSDSRVLNGLIYDVNARITDAGQLGNVGFVPAENLIGPAKVLFWSYDNTLKLSNPISWVTALRWRRLGDLVE